MITSNDLNSSKDLDAWTYVRRKNVTNWFQVTAKTEMSRGQAAGALPWKGQPAICYGSFSSLRWRGLFHDIKSWNPKIAEGEGFGGITQFTCSLQIRKLKKTPVYSLTFWQLLSLASKVQMNLKYLEMFYMSHLVRHIFIFFRLS